MTSRSRFSMASAALAVLVLVLPAVAWANGLAFFKPANGDKVDLVYFGQVKDRDGAPLSYVELAVETTSRYMYEIQFDQDRLGHYRSPDVGLLYKEALQKVEPTLMTITARKYGYKAITRKVPIRTAGALRVDFTMERGEGHILPGEAAPAPADNSPINFLYTSAGVLAALVIVAAARRASRQPSTGDSGRAAA